ncbi:hypothetical protein ACFWUU_29710 [Kribbella sp. NPDC058693]|uniref:hypothetical protein n=1 Tax=Kribbella sp. NPDC058693 TaxID=3346602 RepID=UPI003660688E
MASRRDPYARVSHALDQGKRRVRLGVAAPAQTLRGSQSSLWDCITKLRAQARREILSFDDTSYLLAHDVPDPIQQRGPATLRAALGRGARVRQVTSRAGILADQQLGAIVYRAGGEARVVDVVPLKLSIIDRQTALLPLNSAVLAEGFQIIRDPSVVSALVAVHRTLWNEGAEPEGMERDLPPPHLAAILPALASGATDEVAASRLGLSARTYSRRVGELLTLLGVRNRFQAGAEAVRRGWL